jgi:hypothetical protein
MRKTGYIRSVLKLPSTDPFLPLLLRQIQHLKIPPVMKWPRAITGQQQEHRSACDGDKVQGQEDYKLDDLP